MLVMLYSLVHIINLICQLNSCKLHLNFQSIKQSFNLKINFVSYMSFL